MGSSLTRDWSWATAVEALSPNHRPPGRSWLCRYFEKQKENHFISISLWDRLGPGTLDCSAAMLALGHTPPQATKKLHETKIAACICICCRFWTKDTKRPKNPTATSEETQAKAGYVRHMPPAHNTAWGVGKHLCYPSSSEDKESACQCRRLGFSSWVGKIPWRREWLPTPVSLPGEFHGQRSLASYSPWDRKEFGHEWGTNTHTHTHTHTRARACTHASSWTHDSLHTRNQLGPCWRASEQGKLSLILAPCRYRRGQDKALPEFLVWPLVIFYWLRSPRTWGLGNICNLLFFSFSIDWVHAT